MKKTYPRHIAFIMDGNGRWARERGWERVLGHRQGAERLRDLTRYCRSNGVKETTFYALSTENFKARPKLEVRYLMSLLKDFLIDEREELREQNIRLKSIGRIDELPKSVRRELAKSEELSRDNDGMILRLALNYGSRCELLDAISKISRQIQNGTPAKEFEDLSEDQFRRFLYDPEMSDPDLLIRTAGELRVSNFLLWQISYSEMWVTEKKWPDFKVPLLEQAIASYMGRERRFGRVHTEDEGATA